MSLDLLPMPLQQALNHSYQGPKMIICMNWSWVLRTSYFLL